MSTYLRRIVDLSPAGVLLDDPNRDYRLYHNREYFKATGTKWVRLWAPWFAFQKYSSQTPGTGSNSGAARQIASLDQQVAAANADGVKVMLVSWAVPQWANGTSGITENSAADFNFGTINNGSAVNPNTGGIGPWDRMSKAQWDNWHNFGVKPTSFKSLLYKRPTDTSTTGPWGRWIDWLYNRYRGNNPYGAKATALEILNEPNGFNLWPQQTPVGSSVIADKFNRSAGDQLPIAQLMKTADAIAARYGRTITLVGPGSADSPTNSRLITPYNVFTQNVLAGLDSVGFHGNSRFVWSQHHYWDIEIPLATGARSITTAGLLKGRWNGLAEAAGPIVFLTEGGYRYPVYHTDTATQNKYVADAWARVFADTNAVGMFGNYGMYTDPQPSADCGLRDNHAGCVDVCGDARPVYATWAALPSLA
jgi:hypothetical protein